jgi:hypothetical protein
MMEENLKDKMFGVLQTNAAVVFAVGVGLAALSAVVFLAR